MIEEAASETKISSVEEPSSSQLPINEAEWSAILADDSPRSPTSPKKTDTSKTKSVQRKATTSTKSATKGATAKGAAGKTATAKNSTAKTATAKSAAGKTATAKNSTAKTATARATTSVYDDDTDTFSANPDSSGQESEDESYKVGESSPDEISASDQGTESASVQTAESAGSGEVLDPHQRRLQYVVAVQKIKEKLGGTSEDVETDVIDLVSDSASLNSTVPVHSGSKKRGRHVNQDSDGFDSNANVKRQNVGALSVDPRTPPFSPCESVLSPDPLGEREPHVLRLFRPSILANAHLLQDPCRLNAWLPLPSPESIRQRQDQREPHVLRLFRLLILVNLLLMQDPWRLNAWLPLPSPESVRQRQDQREPHALRLFLLSIHVDLLLLPIRWRLKVLRLFRLSILVNAHLLPDRWRMNVRRLDLSILANAHLLQDPCRLNAWLPL
eukprot:gene35353-43594_t